MDKDLRQFLRDTPAAVVRRRVDPRLEIPAVLDRLERQGRFPMVLFEDVLDTRGEPSGFRLLANAFADRARIASLFGCAPEEMAQEYLRRSAVRPPVCVVNDAPVKQNRLLGDAARLTRLPLVTHHEKDAGPYITSGVVVLRDPDTGVPNGAIQRLQLQGDRQLGLFMVPGGHNDTIYRKYCERGLNAPVAIVVGHHPAFYLGMQHKGALDDSEFEVAGGLLGEPLEVTPAETQPDLLIPARAELVIEGEILRDRLEPEGPFGEYTHYYSPRRESNVVSVTAILHRDEPIFHDVFACHPDHHFLEGVVMESQLLEAVRERHPGVKALCLPPSGCCQFYCYVSLAKRSDDEPRALIQTLLQTSIWIKYVVVVDPDVNVFDEGEVLWAIATRARVSEDFVPFEGRTGTAMDPTARNGTPERGGLDVTLGLGGTYPERVGLPREMVEGIRLGDYEL